MQSIETYKREIESLHEFFVEWFTGRVADDSFERLERALGPDFEMVTPEGKRRERPTIVDGIRGSYDSLDPGEFDIEIRNVEPRYSVGNNALVRYEEWQETPDGTTGRLSTVLFQADSDAPGDLVWRDLHETWIDGTETGDPEPDAP